MVDRSRDSSRGRSPKRLTTQKKTSHEQAERLSSSSGKPQPRARQLRPRDTAGSRDKRQPAPVATGSPNQRRKPKPANSSGSGKALARVRRSSAVAAAPRLGSPDRRQGIVIVLVLMIMIAFAGRLVFLQGVGASEMAQAATQQRTLTVPLYAHRGDITDANGKVLATSVDRYNITVDQTQVSDYNKSAKTGLKGVQGAAEQLSPVLGMSVAELKEALTGDRKGAYVAKDVTPEVRQQVRELGITGIWANERTSERIYPQGQLAGNVVGFMGAPEEGKEKPLAGVEYSTNDELSGTNGSETYERGKDGQVIPTGQREMKEAADGRTVQLTLVSELQWKAQQAIDERVKDTKSEWGTVVVWDLTNGDILALADSNSVDPTQYQETSYYGSRAATEVFEPGSTAKVVTIAAALEQGFVTPTSQFEVEDRLTMPSGDRFRDSTDHEKQQLTLTGILAQSSNTGTVQVGSKLSKQSRFDYLTKFGLGSKTGVELPSESKGILRSVDQWYGRTEYTVLFGQGVAATALQITQVFATLGNDGVSVSPRLVKGYTDADGTYHEAKPDSGTRVISEKAAKQTVGMLRSAVDSGTGSAAAIKGYQIAGKTGTAQVPDADGNLNAIVASFVGIAPADSPRLAVSVVLYKPTKGTYGGALAGPVFREVTGYALEYLSIPPTGTTTDPYPTEW